MRFVMNNVCPHPDPLPRGEGTAMCGFRNFVRLDCTLHLFAFRSEASDKLTAPEHEHARDCRMFLPLLGERAGVRAVVTFPN